MEKLALPVHSAPGGTNPWRVEASFGGARFPARNGTPRSKSCAAEELWHPAQTLAIFLSDLSIWRQLRDAAFAQFAGSRAEK
jgi:hypothetical protein